ncbi:MAG: DUF6270 domain-containing protein, partial [Actinomycetaceae bacterium]
MPGSTRSWRRSRTTPSGTTSSRTPRRSRSCRPRSSDRAPVTDRSSSPQRSVLVHGSCVTRDAFALPEETRFRLADYYARSSLASAF